MSICHHEQMDYLDKAICTYTLVYTLVYTITGIKGLNVSLNLMWNA